MRQIDAAQPHRGLENADEGTIMVAGEPLTVGSEDDHALIRRRHIGIVFQFFNLLEGMTVLENVALPAIIAGRNRKSAETALATCLTCWASATRPRSCPGCSRAVSVSASPSRVRSPTSPPCCSPTNLRRVGLGRRTRGH